MKIEKVNENQIRCTLTKEDLADRQIKLSELAYGSEKARQLFKDMIAQANYEFGFEANDIPLMVEAIPLSGESIILVITKVEYPDELDTRFSKFTEPDSEMVDNEDYEMEFSKQGANDILDLFEKVRKQKEQLNESEPEKTIIDDEIKDVVRMFEFRNLDDVCSAAKVLQGYYEGPNDLYKDDKKSRYYLTLHKGEHTPIEFNKVCNMIAEYGIQKKYTNSICAYFIEHDQVLVSQNAMQMLSEL